jgi:aryl-alcohol dehydrogenase-like predicted oxidoreductase
MQYTLLGKSTVRISKIGFGCMSLGENEAANQQIIHQAIDLGITYFDTADLYDKGKNESSLGKAIKSKRKEVIIATKAGNQWRPDGSGWDWNPRKDYILDAVEKSLSRLGTDYIDLYQLHGGTIEDPIDETIDAFETLVQQGKIRYYGISSIRPNVIREWVSRSNIVSVMMQYSLLDRRPEENVLPLLHEKGIRVLARGSVAQGLLVNKPPKPYLKYSAEEVKEAATAVQALSTPQRTAAQTPVRFVLQHPAVAAAVIGIRTGDQLEEAVKTIAAPQLSPDEIESLQNSIPIHYYEEHR